MIIRAVDWWQPTRRQFGYRDRNTAQTRHEWISHEAWFALKTKGANGPQLGNALFLVGSKSVGAVNGMSLGNVQTLIHRQDEETNAMSLGIGARLVCLTGNRGSARPLGIASMMASSKLLLAKPRTQVEHDWSFQKQRASVFDMGIEQSMACPRTVRRQ